MPTNLDLLRDLFPHRVVLGVDEVAQVLAVGGKKGAYEQTRRELKEGRIIPGLRKIGGTWRVPITEVANHLDRLVEQVPSPAAPKTSRSRVRTTAPTEAPPNAYGTRGRKPDALRLRITEFLSARGIGLRAMELSRSPAPPPRPVFGEHEAKAKAQHEEAVLRAQNYWDAVGAALMREALMDEVPNARVVPSGSVI